MSVHYRRLLRFAAACCALLLVGSPLAGGGAEAATGSGSSSTNQTADQMATLWDGFRTAQLKATTLRGQIKADTAKRNQLQAQIKTDTAAITAAEARRAADVAQLGATDQELAGLQAGIGDTTAKLAAARAQIQARAVELYKQGPSSYLAFLLNAKSFDDFLSRVRYVGGVASSDRAQLAALGQLNTDLGTQKGDATNRRAALAAAKAAVEAETARITSLRSGLTKASADLAATLSQDQVLLSQVEADKATYLQAMATLAGESSSITTMLRNRQIDESYTWGGKKVGWPVKGPISSPFGPRINPIFNTPEFHTGIDIAVDYGLPIKAAAAGQVVSAGLMEGYGNVVILDHGGALATLYAHMSSIAVHQGEKVSSGQTLGAVGCTGLCTGPHVHFETRIGGTPVQPTNLLP